MYQSVNSLFYFNKYSEVCEVSDLSHMSRTNGIFIFDVLPRIGFELLDTKRHFPFSPVKCKYHSINLISHFKEFLGTAKVLRPRHFRNMDKTLDTGSYFNKSSVIGHNDNLTFNLVAHLEVRID